MYVTESGPAGASTSPTPEPQPQLPPIASAPVLAPQGMGKGIGTWVAMGVVLLVVNIYYTTNGVATVATTKRTPYVLPPAAKVPDDGAFAEVLVELVANAEFTAK